MRLGRNNFFIIDIRDDFRSENRLMGLDYYQCHICSTGYEAEFLHDIPIKAYNGDSVRICTNCRDAQFTKSPRHGYLDIDVESLIFIAHDGTEFTDFSDLSEYLEDHPGQAKALNTAFMDSDDLYRLCEQYVWEKMEDHNEENTKWVPTEEFWKWEKRQVSADLERLKKRQKVINNMIH